MNILAGVTRDRSMIVVQRIGDDGKAGAPVYLNPDEAREMVMEAEVSDVERDAAARLAAALSGLGRESAP